MTQFAKNKNNQQAWPKPRQAHKMKRNITASQDPRHSSNWCPPRFNHLMRTSWWPSHCLDTWLVHPALCYQTVWCFTQQNTNVWAKISNIFTLFSLDLGAFYAPRCWLTMTLYLWLFFAWLCMADKLTTSSTRQVSCVTCTCLILKSQKELESWYRALLTISAFLPIPHYLFMQVWCKIMTPTNINRVSCIPTYLHPCTHDRTWRTCHAVWNTSCCFKKQTKQSRWSRGQGAHK